MFPPKRKQIHQKQKSPLVSGKKFLFLHLAVAVAVCGFPNLALAGVETDPRLVKMEVKFFQHDFAKEDDVQARLDRLEKLVFGEGKSGDFEQRFKNLLGAVPNLDASAPTEANAAQDTASSEQSAAPDRDNAAPRTNQAVDHRSAEDAAVTREQNIEGSSQYPAVSAIEKKLLGKDYAGEPIIKRLERLETKTFGKPSGNDDLSERVDALKARSGIDLAKMAPPGSDWADDEYQPPRGGGDITFTPGPGAPGSTTPYADAGEDGRTFSGRDMRRDAQRALGRPVTSSWGDENGVIGGSGGSYGTGSSSTHSTNPDGYQSGGSYGYNAPRKSMGGIPQTAPNMVQESDSTPAPAMGLSQQVTLLENELFRKSFAGDTIPKRLDRLETTVFPGKQSSADMSLPERVRRLTDAVPLSSSPPRIATQHRQDPLDYDDSDMPQPAPQRGPNGISKIINGLGNIITGGGYGAYPMGSNLVTDPQSGLLLDRTSGNIIDPATGVVVGSRNVGMGIPLNGMGRPIGGYPIGTGTSGYGVNGYPVGTGTGYGGGFNNGLSPIGSPYGRGTSFGSGMGFGFGAGGMRMGVPGMMGSGMGIGF